MANTRRDNHMWTKSEIKEVSKLWKTATIKEICDKLGIQKSQLMYMKQQMQKAGFNLPRKHKIGYMQMLLEECKLELDK